MEKPTTTRELLLTRAGLVSLSSSRAGTEVVTDLVSAIEVELGELGYVMSSRLKARALAASRDELIAFHPWALATLARARGSDKKHTPLFRRFPEGIPRDTEALYWKKVLVHFIQSEKQPCLFCGKKGTTHVLDPCRHVVCSHCWDGANYSACPACERHVDVSSPFFLPVPSRALSSSEEVTFQRLDHTDDLLAETRALFQSLCLRKQALSPDDRDALSTVLDDQRAGALAWLPSAIPVRENVAIVFGTLFRSCPAEAVLPHARRFLTTATDVLRFLAVLSGADASLQKTPHHKLAHIDDPANEGSWWTLRAKALGLAASPYHRPGDPVYVLFQSSRFKIAKLPRPLRRALLSILDQIPEDRLIEDMLRHRSPWIRAGEILHPHEYQARYPNAAGAFLVLRQKAPDGQEAPRFHTFYSKVEALTAARDAVGLSDLLSARPGELARRIDLALRLAAGDDNATARVLGAIRRNAPSFATPVLLALTTVLPARTAPAKRRLFWPKGMVANGVSKPDKRPLLAPSVLAAAVAPCRAELLARFAAKPPFDTAIVDEALAPIMVPFNERTASRSAVSLPRGSRVALPEGKALRLFLHWCQPENSTYDTDLDLSIGFYDDAWTHTGVCSYYQLTLAGKSGKIVAVSGGDMRDAPFPDGASELVDLDREQALAEGFRYAVMVVNAYSGLPFDRLERAFAGVMVRSDTSGAYFDPRTVELKFALAGSHGIFMPLVVDLKAGALHWLDVYSEGKLIFNNVQTSNGAITRICPDMMDYFASGVRPTMLDLGLYHAAARAKSVYLRPNEGGDEGPWALFVRREGESAVDLYDRLKRREADEPRALPPKASSPVLAVLHRGDVELPEGSTAYALFREDLTRTIAASDLLS